ISKSSQNITGASVGIGVNFDSYIKLMSPSLDKSSFPEPSTTDYSCVSESQLSISSEPSDSHADWICCNYAKSSGPPAQSPRSTLNSKLCANAGHATKNVAAKTNAFMRANTQVKPRRVVERSTWQAVSAMCFAERSGFGLDRKSTRLNSSHVKISYAVFCLKKK